MDDSRCLTSWDEAERSRKKLNCPIFRSAREELNFKSLKLALGQSYKRFALTVACLSNGLAATAAAMLKTLSTASVLRRSFVFEAASLGEP